MIRKTICILLMLAIFIQPVTAFHWIVGEVVDARDGTPALNHTVRMWYEGTSNYYWEDVVGVECYNPTMNPDNYYLINIEAIPNDFQTYNHNWDSTGRNVCLQIIDNGDGYISDVVTVMLSEYSWDLAPTMFLRKI